MCWTDHSSRGVLPIVVCLECDRESLIMGRPWPTRAVAPLLKNIYEITLGHINISSHF